MKNRVNSIRGLKAILLLGIFLAHTGVWESTYHLAQRACDLLFLLSGFSIAYQHNADKDFVEKLNTPVKYFKKKILSVYPLHFLTWLSAWILFYREDSPRETIVQSALNLTLLQSWFTYNGCVYYYNSVSWFLSSLLFCYIIAPFGLMYIQACKHVKAGFLILIILRILLEYLSVGFLGLNIYHNPLFSCLTFLIGMQLYFTRGGYKPSIYAVLQAILPLLIIVLSIKFDNSIMISFYVIFEALFVLSMVKAQGIVGRLLSGNIWQVIGNIQFEFFMIHQIVIRVLRQFELRGAILIVSAFIITVLFSYVLKNSWIEIKEVVKRRIKVC